MSHAHESQCNGMPAWVHFPPVRAWRAGSWLLLLVLSFALAPAAVQAQEVLFETAADMPVLVSPRPLPEDRLIRLGMHGNVERKSRIFYLGLGAAALLTPDFAYLSGTRVRLRTSLGIRFRTLTSAAADFVARRVAVVGPAIHGDLGTRFQLNLGEQSWLYARVALRYGGDITRIQAVDLGREEEDASEVVTATMISPHFALGGGVGPAQIGVELDYYEVPGQAGPSLYQETLDGHSFIGFFAVLRLSRHVYFYGRVLPFAGSPFLYTWGIAAALNPYDP